MEILIYRRQEQRDKHFLASRDIGKPLKGGQKINENNFENYKVIEMYYKENVISRYLENFFLKDNKLVCDKLDTNLVSILPTYLSSC